MGFVLAWSSGHTPPRTMYYRQGTYGWGATEAISEAHQFGSKKEALVRFLKLHAFPDEYEHCIREGSVRAVAADFVQMDLNL